jgi:hypothetical protein
MYTTRGGGVKTNKQCKEISFCFVCLIWINYQERVGAKVFQDLPQTEGSKNPEKQKKIWKIRRRKNIFLHLSQ